MKSSVVYAAIGMLLLAAACRHDNVQELYPAVPCIADTAQVVSFSKNIIPIFRNNCNSSGCHTGSNAAGNLDLDSAAAYAQLSKYGTGYIDTSNPAASLIYAQLFSTADPMPPTGTLDDCSKKLILKWLQQKAFNN